MEQYDLDLLRRLAIQVHKIGMTLAGQPGIVTGRSEIIEASRTCYEIAQAIEHSQKPEDTA